MTETGVSLSSVLINSSTELDPKELERLVIALDLLYYVYGVSLVSDGVYDILEDSLPATAAARSLVGWSDDYLKLIQ